MATNDNEMLIARIKGVPATKDDGTHEGNPNTKAPHKTMTAEEYLAANIKGWHEVCWRIDSAGNVGVRYLSD